MNKKDIFNVNLAELKKSYYISSLPETLSISIAEKAAKKGLYVYTYHTAISKGPALETRITVVLTTDSERKRYSQTKTQLKTYEKGIYFELGRARVCKTPRGSLWQFVEGINDYLS